MSLELLHGDCLHMLQWLEDQSIDLTVTSPPYDNLRSYGALPLESFQKVSQELFRITKPGGVVVWVIADATINGSETGTSFKHALYFKEIGFNLHDTMIWEKPTSAFQHRNRYIHSFEYMFVLSNGKPKTVNLIKDRKNKYWGQPIHGTERQRNHQMKKMSQVQTSKFVKEYGARINRWAINPQLDRTRSLHPAMFPESLARDHIITWSNPGDTVIDPFLGSGTTGKMAKQLGRNFIGIEKEESYFKIAQERIYGF